MPATESLSDPNLRSPTYYVARTSAPCGACGLSTHLLALALPRTHEILEADGESDEVDPDRVDSGDLMTDSWQHADVEAFVFYVEQLPDRVRHQLQRISPVYRQAQSAATQSTYWVNHCEHCGAMLEDYELHCEPEGAFMPCSEAEAAKIRLLRISEPIEAVAAGYTPDPVFFASMPAS
jgi:hypothetical protein